MSVSTICREEFANLWILKKLCPIPYKFWLLVLDPVRLEWCKKVEPFARYGAFKLPNFRRFSSAEEDADLTQLLDEDAAEREAIRNQIPDSTAREEHDTAVVSKIRLAAITAMAEHGVTVDAKDSLRSGAKNPALILEQPVRALMKDKDLNLKAYKLTNDQWNLAADLRDVLECVKEPTLQFSKGGNARPLISDVIPALESLRNSLINASNSDDIADICRVAAYGGSLVLDKYIDLVPNCEAYEFAIVSCPHLKLDWFKQNGRSSTQIQRIRESIVARFEELFQLF
ncbi:hypothetical protein R3P38DRAFT_2777196 [Favolaschia claudopus]|uniref:Uncharacterized protein n=1 Tax=Favolaschia claudopus TaxID=2862362 RepID=A0AAW0BML7_9AGAR